MRYLFLDTQVFDANAYDFQNKHFRQICALAESDDVCLLMPEITRREIELHIAAKAKDAYVALDKLRRYGFHKNLRVPPFDAIAKGTTEEAIRKELMEQFTEFCKEAKVTHLPAKELDLAAVLDDYFNQKPPFGDAKKKSEFPDAFTAKILTAWCEKHSRKAIVVSGDGDWATVVHPTLQILDNVTKFLDQFPDPIIANKVRTALRDSSYLIKRLKEQFEETKFSDRDRNAEISDVEATDVEIGSVYAIDISDGMATMEADVCISYSAHVEGRTRLRSYRYDDGYGEDDWVSERISGSMSTTATIEVYYDADDPSDIDFAGVSLGGISPYMDMRGLFQ